jgi:hypothetical protein
MSSGGGGGGGDGAAGASHGKSSRPKRSGRNAAGDAAASDPTLASTFSPIVMPPGSDGGSGAAAGAAAGAGGGAGVAAGGGGGDPVVRAVDRIPDWICHDCKVPLRRGEETGMYSAVDVTQFQLRGRTYLADKIKVPSKPEAFRLLGVNVFLTREPVLNFVEAVPSLRDFITTWRDHTDQFFVMAFMLPGRPVHNVVYLFARVLPEGEDPAFDKVLENYLKGDSAFRSTRLKLLARLEKAPWIVSVPANKLGIDRPAILGNKLAVHHYTGTGYFEANVDVGSSMIATAIHGIILKGCSSIVVVTAFTLEGQEEEELPERMLGSARFHHIDVPNVISDLRHLL